MKYISFDDAVRTTYLKTRHADHMEFPGITRYEYTQQQILVSILQAMRSRYAGKLDLYEKLTEWPNEGKMELIDNRNTKGRAANSISLLANDGTDLYLKNRQFKKWLKKQTTLKDL